MPVQSIIPQREVSLKDDEYKGNKMELKEFERIDDLNLDGLRIIQNKNHFCFGTDAVLLASFADIKPNMRVLDLCAGNGIIPILLAAKKKAAHITGIEFFEEHVQMAKRSVILNGLQEKVDFLTGDIKAIRSLVSCGCFDYVTVNPPYKPLQSGFQNRNDLKTAARHEIFCTLEDVIKAARFSLRSGGKLAMVHRADRLAEVIYLMRENRIEPKKLTLVFARKEEKPKLMLIEGLSDGGTGINVTAPLFIYGEDGTYTEQFRKIYGKEKNND